MNIPEILVANGTGAALVISLFCLRVRTGESKLVGKRIFDRMLVATLLALTAETLGFLTDGQHFPGARELQYLCSTFCTGATVYVGFCWCLFVDYRIYRSMTRLRRARRRLSIPMLLCLGLLLVNLAGVDIVFTVSADNVYSRGPLNFLFYIAVAVYYGQSVLISAQARREGRSVSFFPVAVFLLPCLVGTVLQGIFYGLAIVWLTVAMALVFLHIQLQNNDTFVDEMSGLFNRKYLNFYLDQAKKSGTQSLYGIMLDVNDFKTVNDTFGHAMGDRAIHETGTILSSALPEGGIAMRMGGDEFIVLLPDATREQAERTRRDILENEAHFNASGEVPFRLSLSLGTARFDGENIEGFLSDLDQAMYADKKQYHTAADGKESEK